MRRATRLIAFRLLSIAAIGSLCFAARIAPPEEFPPKAPIVAKSAEPIPGSLPPSLTAVKAAGKRWRVDFTFKPQEPNPKSVSLAGSFNTWNKLATPMRRAPDGAWTASVELPEGVTLYKFVVDGEQWFADPANPEGDPDGNGGRNSVLRLGDAALLRQAQGVRGDGKINAAALGHDPARAQDREHRRDDSWAIRYRTLAEDVDSVNLATRELGSFPMRRVGRLDSFDWWEVVLPRPRSRTDYTFLISDGATQLRDAEIYSLDPAAASSFVTPDWAKNAVWYHIMVDRFRNGDASNDPQNTRPWRSEWYATSPWEGANGETFYNHFVFGRMYGGDIAGMTQALPYLKELGVNALYLLPMFEASTPHKYNATNYLHIDDAFGKQGGYAKAAAVEDLLDSKTWTWTESDKQFLAFLKEAKKQGFKVIIDGVFNHVGTHHPAFLDVKKNGRESRFADWFNIKSWDPFDYEGWFGHSELPTFRKDEEHGIASDSARRHILEVTRRWMDPNGDGDPSDGIDGWRLDVPNEIPMSFWREWRTLVKKINPQAYITGEIWTRADAWLDGNAFDAVMNYEFCKPAIEWIINRTTRITPSELDAHLAKLRLAYPAEATYAMQNLLDSHDTDRIVSMARNPDRVYNENNREQSVTTYDASKPREEDYRRVRLLALLQMTYVGAPMIWYGTEAGMWGSGDPNNRKPMLWKDHEPYEQPEDNHVMGEQLAYYKSVTALRNNHSALRTGSFQTVLTDDAKNVWVFLRSDASEQVLVALNASDQGAMVELPAEIGEGWSLIFGSQVEKTKFPAVTIPATAGCVWVRPAPK
ncbi:MAG: alpha-glucosidase C-terminal domain-containing protein [Planctomycetes bacterium]|nr:alpha-glucosidase C-terminal domain-containing protein [Planctomycetota bacterium]